MLAHVATLLALLACVAALDKSEMKQFGNKAIGPYYVNANMLSWTDAYAACKAGGNSLAVLDTEGEAAFLKENMIRYEVSEIHLGFHDQFTEGVYKTLAGEVVPSTGPCPHTDWAVGSPIGGSSRNCGGFSLEGMTDTACSELRMSVCETGQRKSYDSIPGHNEYKYFSGLYTWPEASDICASEGSHLVLLNSLAEVEALIEHYPQMTSEVVWIGVHRMFGENLFVTETDNLVPETDYPTWWPGHPRANHLTYPYVGLQARAGTPVTHGRMTMAKAFTMSFVCEHS